MPVESPRGGKLRYKSEAAAFEKRVETAQILLDSPLGQSRKGEVAGRLPSSGVKVGDRGGGEEPARSLRREGKYVNRV